MTKQLFFYEKAVPVSVQRHGAWSIKSGQDYLFAKHTNAVPLTALEFPNAAPEYAIVFSGSAETLIPVVVLGTETDQNLYVDNQGNWQAKYIPAFVRRYPFVFSSKDDGRNLTLCLDEDFAGCNQDGVGERLFDTAGERTQYLGTVLNFLKEYQAHFIRTQTFCKKLKELDLLEAMHAQFTLPSGGKKALTGFMAINREKLQGLPADSLSELSKSGELELMYLHLQSMRNFSAMVNRVPGTEDPSNPASASPSEDRKEQATADA